MHVNPYNPNQTLYFEDSFNGFPIYLDRGPLVLEYLQTVHRVTGQALAEHRRVTGIRFDLRFPQSIEAGNSVTTNAVMSRFIDSLKAKIRHNRTLAKDRNPYAHDTEVRYVWAREVGGDGRVHYHGALLLNREAYFSLGHFESDVPNMANRLNEAWASALNLPKHATKGLVQFPKNAVYRFDSESTAILASFLYRASYLCKADTKCFGNGQHGFGASRN